VSAPALLMFSGPAGFEECGRNAPPLFACCGSNFCHQDLSSFGGVVCGKNLLYSEGVSYLEKLVWSGESIFLQGCDHLNKLFVRYEWSNVLGLVYATKALEYVLRLAPSS
jgi:hypothetical protein